VTAKRAWSADRVVAGNAALMTRLVPGGVRVESPGPGEFLVRDFCVVHIAL